MGRARTPVKDGGRESERVDPLLQWVDPETLHPRHTETGLLEVPERLSVVYTPLCKEYTLVSPSGPTGTQRGTPGHKY